MALDPTIWMPELMDSEEKDEWAAAYPDDAHRAAGAAWESWAAQLKATGEDVGVTSVSTGAQSISYATGTSAVQRALDVAAWHYARSPAGAVLSPDYNRTPDTPITSQIPPTWREP